MNFYEMRFNLIKNGVISTLFCSKLAKFKIESYLNEFMQRFKRTHDIQINSSELQIIIDILFYFYRRHTRVDGVHVPGSITTATTTNATNDAANNMASSYYDPDDDSQSNSGGDDENNTLNMDANNGHGNSLGVESSCDQNDDDDSSCDSMLRADLAGWIKTLACLLVNHTDAHRAGASAANFAAASLVHFENVHFILEHLLRVPDCGQLSSLYQLPMLPASFVSRQKIELNSSKSDPIINLYFDGYMRLIVPFSRPIKQRDAFMFLNKSRIEAFRKRMNKQGDKCWQFVDLEGKRKISRLKNKNLKRLRFGILITKNKKVNLKIWNRY